MQNSSITDPRAQFWGKLAKWGFLIVSCAVFAPFIWIAVGGLLGLILFVAIALGAWMVRPAVFTLAANLRIKLIKEAAAINPVESLQEEHRRWGVQLDERSKGIQEQHAANREFLTTIESLARDFPDDPQLPQMRDDYAQLEAAVAEAEASWKVSYAQREEFARGVERAKRVWASALALAKARGKSALSEEEWQARLKTEVAFDTIRQRFDQGLAGATVDRMKLEAARAARQRTLPASATAAIDVTPPKPAQLVEGRMPPGRDDLPRRIPGRTNA